MGKNNKFDMTTPCELAISIMYTIAEREERKKLECDFCHNERKVLTKRDAGYDEWTCATCHKEQYPEQYEDEDEE